MQSIRFRPTLRGFARADFCDLSGSACSIQKSSLVTPDAIWFGVDKDPDEGVSSSRMHLSRALVMALLPHLQHFVSTGELSMVRVGVVGYCPPTKFDEDEARCMVVDAYDQIMGQFPDQSIAIVSGLTNVGVFKIAYEEAATRGWSTVGVACKRATEHPLYPVDTKIIIGENWGDESSWFVGMLDAMVRIGVGPQSIRETEAVKASCKPTFEYDLPVLT
jgi:hypothetical protein